MLGVALVLTACGGSGEDTGSGGAGGSGATAGSGGASSGGSGAHDAGTDAMADSAACTSLKSEMEATLAQAQSCYAGTPNPSSCEIVQDAICNCVAVQSGYASQYLDAAKAYAAAGCPYTCSAAPCPTAAVCKAAGGTQGSCEPSG